MRLEEFDYHLPPERIAQHPLPERDRSRLLVIKRESGTITQATFRDLPQYLKPGDLLVVNDTRVAPLRLSGKKTSGGKAELTLVKKVGPDHEWECLARARNLKPGAVIVLDQKLKAEIMGVSESLVRVSGEEGAPLWKVRFSGASLDKALKASGLPPLPPYIRRRPDDDPAEDRQRYQTVYARKGQAAAAPTAGLHFTRELMAALRRKGVETARLRLDVSYGTFAPVRVKNIEDHRMHPEPFELPGATAAAVARARARGGRVVAVGTTAMRVLEHCARGPGVVDPGRGETALYIYPGFIFRVVDAMITNFHMPRSTLLMLVSAFAGRELILRAYQYALDRGFRFLSYGDATLII
jgi:S-adenosylmethionine:tRNA ribosyltransferase-isomerase